jgi:hypothetical protein
MKGILKKSICIILASGMTSIALTADLVGKWTGKMTLDGSAIKKQLREESAKLTGERKKQVENRIKIIDESIQIVEKTKIKMDIKKGGVAFIDFNRNGKSEPEWCKWSVKGKKVALTGFSGGGNAMMNLDGVVADAGKSLVFDMSSIMAQQMNAQGLKSAKKPKMTLTFRKS